MRAGEPSDGRCSAVTPTAKRSRVRLGAGSALAGGTGCESTAILIGQTTPARRAKAGDSGVACVLVASPDRREKLSVCGYLVDTWCLGVKNTIGPQRMGPRELDAFKRQYFGPWESEGIPVPLELARHLVLGAVDYARSLGFEPHPDFRRAGRALGSWDGPSSITFGRDGKPLYVNGPHDHPQRVLATLERAVGRGGFHYSVSRRSADGLGDGYRYTASLTDLDDLGDAA